jgi:hypothetical protein
MELAVLGLHESSLKQTVVQVLVWIEPSRLPYLLASKFLEHIVETRLLPIFNGRQRSHNWSLLHRSPKAAGLQAAVRDLVLPLHDDS